VDNRLTFAAIRLPDGHVGGRIDYTQTVNGESFRFGARVTCLALYDGGRRAKLGGVVERSNDPRVLSGTTFMWLQAVDNGRGRWAPPDQSTMAGFGDEAANEAFCANAAPPDRIFDVKGDIWIHCDDSPPC
jgi:hypothetical protein